MKVNKMLKAMTVLNGLLMANAFLYNATKNLIEPTPLDADTFSHHFNINKISQVPLFKHEEKTFSNNASNISTSATEEYTAYPGESTPVPSSTILDLVTDEVKEPAQFNELLDFIEMNMASYGEDVLASCIDEADVRNMIKEATEDYKTSIRKLFILELVLFGVAFSLCIVTLGVVCRKNVKKRRFSRPVFNSKKKSFISDYETSELYTDATDPSFEQNSIAHPSTEANHHNHAYSVHV